MQHLAALDRKVAATKGHAVKESTKKNLTQINAYQKFCTRYGLQYFPCDNRQLCRFGQHLSDTFESLNSVGNYISGIRTCLALLGMEIPDANDKQMKLFSAGLRRVMQYAVKQAEPITPNILIKISKVVNF